MTKIDIDTFRSSIHGGVLTPADLGFELSHRGFNLAETHQPQVVVQAVDTSDVAAAVRLAAEVGLQVRVQATGHGMGLPMAGGVLISTAAMQAMTIDPERRTARVSAGARWYDVIAGAGAYGLATLCGSSPTVGVVGYSLGGGMGPMARTFGFAADRVQRLTMIDAPGTVVTVDHDHQPDLLWALRGGKPEFGIVTEIEFDLLDVPTYYGGAIAYSGDQAAAVLQMFAQWAPSLPDSVSTSIVLLRLPDMPEIPQPLRGTLSVQLRFVHIGDPARGAELLAPMRAVAVPLLDLVDVNPAQAIASVHQDPTDPMPVRDEGLLLGSLPSAAIDALLAVAGPDIDIPLLAIEIRLMGGALSQEQPSAVGGRHGAFSVDVIGAYPPPLRDAVDASSAVVLGALRPWAAGGALVNFLGAATSPAQARAAWKPDVRDRLDALKHAWDPDDVFRFGYSAGGGANGAGAAGVAGDVGVTGATAGAAA